MLGDQFGPSKFSKNGEEDVTALGAHDVVNVTGMLHAEVSPTAQISRTSTEYDVFAFNPDIDP